MEPFRVVDLPEQRTAVVRDTVPLDALKDFFDTALPAAMAAVQRAGGHPAGPPFALYHGMPTETVDLEAGFPIAGPFEPDGRVVASVLPAGRAATAMHIGPYEKLAETYGRLLGWMGEQGLSTGNVFWEVYLSDPSAEPDPSTWRTELYCSIA